jgi:predicted nicotinamide N-methyase
VFRRFTNSSTRSIIKNNSILVTNTATASDINLNSTALDIASSDEYGGNSSVWNARLNSFVVYNRGLSDLEIQKNFEAIRGRFKL